MNPCFLSANGLITSGRFALSTLRVDTPVVREDIDTLQIRATVRNDGAMAAQETVFLSRMTISQLARTAAGAQRFHEDRFCGRARQEP